MAAILIIPMAAELISGAGWPVFFSLIVYNLIEA